MLLTTMLKIFVRKYYLLLNLKSDSHTAVISAKLNFPPIVFKKYFCWFGWHFKIKTNGFKKCKFCILGKHINLYQAVTFCINDYLLYANTKISFLWSFSGLGAHTSTFQVFFFQLYFNKNMSNSHQWFHNASNYFEIA